MTADHVPGRPGPTGPPEAAPLLVGTGLTKRYGPTQALSGASVRIQAGEVVLLVTALSTPALWRLMRADGLRTE